MNLFPLRKVSSKGKVKFTPTIRYCIISRNGGGRTGKMKVWGDADSRTSQSFDVRSEQVSLVVRQLPLVFLSNIINPLLTAAVLAAIEPVFGVTLWAGLLVALTGIRFLHF